VAETMALIDSRAAAEASDTANGDRVCAPRRLNDSVGGGVGGFPGGNFIGSGSGMWRD
jgi:hypothetical protein